MKENKVVFISKDITIEELITKHEWLLEKFKELQQKNSENIRLDGYRICYDEYGVWTYDSNELSKEEIISKINNYNYRKII